MRRHVLLTFVLAVCDPAAKKAAAARMTAMSVSLTEESQASNWSVTVEGWAVTPSTAEEDRRPAFGQTARRAGVPA